MNTVYTYYVKVDEEQHQKSEPMLEHWRRSWASRGWNPVVLGEHHAQAHPLYGLFKNAVSKFPTINVPEYEMACYLRWLAVAALGGGFMSDYDVVNYSFNASPVPAEMKIYEVHPELEAVTPSVVAGTPAGYERVCAAFCAVKPEDIGYFIDEKAHSSDMIVLQHLAHKGFYAATRTVRQYGEPEWTEAPLVHYSNDSTIGTDRVHCMRSARSL